MITKLTVLLGFVVAFSAGLLTGLNSRQPSPPEVSSASAEPTTQRGGPRERDRDRDRDRDRGFLSRELNLSPEQREQMKQIWSPVAARSGREQDELRRRYRNERDEAIADFIRTQDLHAYDQILKAYQDKLAALDQEFRSAYQKAVDQTRQILTPEQRAKYEELLKRNQPGERGPRERRGDRSD
jgi:Spy/CpxP family protein refolding chaperone